MTSDTPPPPETIATLQWDWWGFEQTDGYHTPVRRWLSITGAQPDAAELIGQLVELANIDNGGHPSNIWHATLDLENGRCLHVQTGTPERIRLGQPGTTRRRAAYPTYTIRLPYTEDPTVHRPTDS